MSNEAHDNVLLHGEYLDAALELREINEQISELTARQKVCKEILEKLLSVGERGVDKDNIPIVAIRAGAGRFSPERATERLPASVLLTVCTSAPDGKLAKALLPPTLYEECLTYNKASVVAL